MDHRHRQLTMICTPTDYTFLQSRLLFGCRDRADSKSVERICEYQHNSRVQAKYQILSRSPDQPDPNETHRKQQISPEEAQLAEPNEDRTKSASSHRGSSSRPCPLRPPPPPPDTRLILIIDRVCRTREDASATTARRASERAREAMTMRLPDDG